MRAIVEDFEEIHAQTLPEVRLSSGAQLAQSPLGLEP